MNFLVLLLVALILKWTPWRTGYPQDLASSWIDRIAWGSSPWAGLLMLLLPLVPAALVLWLVQGIAYGLFTLLLHVLLLLTCVGRSDPLGRLMDPFADAWERGDYAAAAVLAEQELGLVVEEHETLLSDVRGKMVAAALHDYFVPAFWYLLLGPLGALAYRLLLVASQREQWPAARLAANLAHALEWVPVRLLGLSFALVGHFDDTLRVLRSLAADWDLPAGELASRCARAAVVEPEQTDAGVVSGTRPLLIRALLAWAVVIAFLSMLS